MLFLIASYIMSYNWESENEPDGLKFSTAYMLSTDYWGSLQISMLYSESALFNLKKLKEHNCYSPFLVI